MSFFSQNQSKNALPETNSKFTPENGWLEDDRFLLGWPIFRGYVSFREGTSIKEYFNQGIKVIQGKSFMSRRKFSLKEGFHSMLQSELAGPQFFNGIQLQGAVKGGYPMGSMYGIPSLKLTKSPLKMGHPKRKGSSSNHPFSGASC